MITNAEVRFGNFVTLIFENLKEYTVRVVEINHEGFKGVAEHVFPDYTCKYEPILLTSELLTEKCGFLSDESGKHWIGDFELYPIGKGFDYEGKVLITSVHQLQNIYYFLNGSELPINF